MGSEHSGNVVEFEGEVLTQTLHEAGFPFTARVEQLETEPGKPVLGLGTLFIFGASKRVGTFAPWNSWLPLDIRRSNALYYAALYKEADDRCAAAEGSVHGAGCELPTPVGDGAPTIRTPGSTPEASPVGVPGHWPSGEKEH